MPIPVNILVSLFAILVLVSTTSHSVEIRIREDRIWLQADQEPLDEVLTAITHNGILVEVDPAIEATVECDIQDQDIEEVFEKLFEDLDYVLYWKKIRWPVGSFSQPERLQLFLPGEKRNIKLFSKTKGRLEFVQIPGQDIFYAKGEILVGFKKGITDETFKQFLAEIDGVVVDSVIPPGIYRIRVDPNTDILSLTDRLKNHRLVAGVEPNYAYDVNEPNKIAEYNPGSTTKLNLDLADVEGSPIAILDSGLQALAELIDHIIGSLDALNPDAPITDAAGHGTQMALIASGAVVPGGAPEIEGDDPKLIAIRSFDENGRSTSFSLMNSVQYALEKGARYMSMSWGSEAYSEFLEPVLSEVCSKGVIPIASVGNEPTRPIYPAAYPSVLGIGALYGDSIWERSNFGEPVDLVAPGTGKFLVGIF
ncbi:MAG: S8 family serine peptidase [Kiritimatiellae bacterium]|nr:S8 family serine peptidase [Kiritimatiellia bacterium]